MKNTFDWIKEVYSFVIGSKDIMLRGSFGKRIFVAVFWAFVFWCLTAPSPASAMVVSLKKEVNPISKKSGEWEADILIKNKRIKKVTAMGEWRVLKDKRSVFFTLTHIKKGNDYYTIKDQPSAKENIAKNKTFRKGRIIILGGENDSEISQIIGVDQKTYNKTKRGKEGGGGTGSGGGDSEGGSSSLGGGSGGKSSDGSLSGISGGGSLGDLGDGSDGSLGGGGNGGSGSGGGNDNGVIGGGGNGGNGGSNGGNGSGTPLPPFGGGDDSGGGSGGGGSLVPPSINDGNDNNYPNYPYPPITNNPGNGGNGGGGSNGGGGGGDYSSQYCKPPQKRGNRMFLSVIDKAGNCLEIEANRDDTKCEYRYDFGIRKAIKQTQFYYVDLENVTQNIGSCVDLEPEGQVSHRYDLYASDTKCKLNVTDNKDYAGGKVFEFQKQILFRGADGMVHIARNCGDYAIVEEDLIEHRYDENAKVLYRIVDRYYEDPFYRDPRDPSKPLKVYIAKGVKSPYSFKAEEYGCGDWEHNDTQKESIRRTQIKAYDEKSNIDYPATPCDFSTVKGKTGKIIQPYTKIGMTEKPGEIPGNNNLTKTWEIAQEDLFKIPASSTPWECWNNDPPKRTYGRGGRAYTKYALGNKRIIAKWTVKYVGLRVGQKTKYQRPKQSWESQASIYEEGSTRDIWERTLLTSPINEAGLSDEWRKFFEVSNGYWQSPQVLQSKEYNEWESNYHKKGKGNYAISYTLSNTSFNESDESKRWKYPGCGTLPGKCGCSTSYKEDSVATPIWSNYIIPNNTTSKAVLEAQEKEAEKKRKEKEKREIQERKLQKMRNYEKTMKRVKGGGDDKR